MSKLQKRCVEKLSAFLLLQLELRRHLNIDHQQGPSVKTGVVKFSEARRHCHVKTLPRRKGIRQSNLSGKGYKPISKQYGVHCSAGRTIISKEKHLIQLSAIPRGQVVKFTPVSDCWTLPSSTFQTFLRWREEYFRFYLHPQNLRTLWLLNLQ